MEPINKVWVNKDDVISWHQGPLADGRNGAFMLDVLGACKTYVVLSIEGMPPISVCGMGYAFAWTDGHDSLRRILNVCLGQLEYFQCSEFACDENDKAIKELTQAVELTQKSDISVADNKYILGHINVAISALEARASRRSQEGKLGTHIP